MIFKILYGVNMAYEASVNGDNAADEKYLVIFKIGQGKLMFLFTTRIH